MIHIPAVPYAIMLENRIGYVPLQRFNETATAGARGVRPAALQREGAKALILDLRENPGGILEQSLDITDLFLPAGQEIASVRARNGEEQKYTTRSQAVVPDLPLVVLTGEYSASASEIVAGALQDHDRALVIGATTFGKGLVQSVFNLDGGYALKLTTAKWFTPSRAQHPPRAQDRERPVRRGSRAGHQRDRGVEAREAGVPLEGGPGGVRRRRHHARHPREGRHAHDCASRTSRRRSRPRRRTCTSCCTTTALELARTANGNYAVTPAQRAEFRRRIGTKGVAVDDSLWNGGTRYVDRLIEQRVARLAAGDSTAKRQDIRFDAPLRRAIDVLKQGQTQADLFTLAAATVSTRTSP